MNELLYFFSYHMFWFDFFRDAMNKNSTKMVSSSANRFFPTQSFLNMEVRKIIKKFDTKWKIRLFTFSEDWMTPKR